MDSKKCRNFCDDNFFVIFEIMGCLLIYKQIMGWLIKHYYGANFKKIALSVFEMLKIHYGEALEVSLSIFVPLVFLFMPTLKNCFFAMLLPTHQNQPYPKNCYGHSGDFFFFFFFFFLVKKTPKPMIQFQISVLIKAS